MVGPLSAESWLVRDFGVDPGRGLDAVADSVVERTSLVDADRAAVRAVLDVVTKGSAWRAFQLKDPLNITILQQAREAAAGASSDPEIVVENTVRQIRQAMFPVPSSDSTPVVSEGSYLKQWWRQHVRRG